MKEPETSKPTFTKTRIIKEDGRYLIYYSFVAQGEESVAPPADDDQAGAGPDNDAGPQGSS